MRTGDALGLIADHFSLDDIEVPVRRGSSFATPGVCGVVVLEHITGVSQHDTLAENIQLTLFVVFSTTKQQVPLGATSFWAPLGLGRSKTSTSLFR